METSDLKIRRVHAPGRCASCGRPLAIDQRYCLHCGTRRGPLPAAIDATVRDFHRTEPVVPEPVQSRVDDGPSPSGRGTQLPPPRALSLVVMAMLSFGVVVGSLTGPGGAESLAKSLVVSVARPPALSSPVASSGAAGTGRGSSSAASSPTAIPETITQTTPTPAAGGTASGSGTGSGSGSGSGSVSSSGLGALPPIKHVFLIMLSDQGYNQSFASSTGHRYLSNTLRTQGELINNYYGVASSSLANGIALISGQGPTQQTADDCPVFLPISPATTDKDAQVRGTGCVYPRKTETLPGEMHAAGFTWRAYIQGMQAAPSGKPTSCLQPALGSADPYRAPQARDSYVTWRNPFVYFRSITATSLCAKDDVALPRLARDLKQAVTTPDLSYIAPDPCDNGSEQPCRTGTPAGLAAADTFLKSVVPRIEASAAYKSDGLIVITFDQAPQTGGNTDSSSCCDEPSFPNLSGTGTTTIGTTPTTTGTTTTGTTSTPPCPGTPGSSTTTTTGTTTTGSCSSTGSPPGGGQVGALLISRYVKPGSDNSVATLNHFSLLKTIEDLFKLKHLGYSRDSSLPKFDSSIFNAWQQS
ncbi:MAG: hypothetical protein M3065_16070 [Actinomycetota bacterium]|nr:hypothetical protein [Actinomycetota bacterium]